HYENGEPATKVGALQDISSRKFHEIIIGLEKELYELNANPQVSFEEIPERLFANLGNLLPGARFSIVMLKDDRLDYYTGKGLSAEFIGQINGLSTHGLQTSTAAAIARGKCIFTDSISKDPIWKKLRKAARQENLETCWSIPIKTVTGKIFACFDIYFIFSKQPDASEITLVERA